MIKIKKKLFYQTQGEFIEQIGQLAAQQTVAMSFKKK